MMERRKEKMLGFIFALLAGILWAISGAAAQYLFEYKGMVSTWLVPYRLIFSGLGMLLFVLIVARKQQGIFEIWKNQGDMARVFVFAILGMMATQFCYFIAVETTNAGTATVLQYLNPAMMMVFFCIINRSMPHKLEVMSIVLALVGILLVATHGSLEGLVISPEGLFWGVCCALATCFNTILPVPLLKKYPPTIASGWAMLIGGMMLFFITRPWNVHMLIDSEVVALILVIIILGTIVPFCLFLMAIRCIGPVYTGVISSIEPVVAAILSACLLGTKFIFLDILGFTFIISTILLLALKKE
ncbi:DMT family transporter [Lachnospiraceae bacterium LCP25S3_G4]